MMQGKLRRNSLGFVWPLVLAVLSSAACGSPPSPTATPSTLPPSKPVAAKSKAEPTPGTQQLELVTAHVTAADVAIAPDGKWLAFDALGHLYRLSAKGGDAEQLTFGAYYDREPAISPDGRRVVFVSNRGPSGADSLFLLNLSTGEISEIAGAPHAAQPAWSPDGTSVGFVSRPPFAEASVRRVDLAADRIHTLATHKAIEALAFLNDGRLVWSVRDPDQEASQILAQAKGGATTTELNVKGAVLDIVRDPKSDALFLELHRASTRGFADPQPATIVSVRLPGGEPKPVTSVENAAPNARFSALDGKLWLCERGTLWQVDAGTGKKQPLRLSLEATLEVLPRATPRWTVPAARPAALLDPRIVGKSAGIIFTAAGYLWHQAPNTKPSRVTAERDGYEWGPAAPSPDGTRIAVQVSSGTTQELRIIDREGATLRTVVATDRSVNFQPAWHPSGNELAYVASSEGVPHLFTVDLKTGKRSALLATAGTWQPTPHFSDDGSWLYYSRARSVEKLRVKGTGKVEAVPLTAFRTPFDRALVAPDGRSVAFARGDELWWAPASGESATIREEAAMMLSATGGRGFSFAPGASPSAPSIVYASGHQVLQQTVATDLRAIASLELPAAPSEPFVVRNARLLDFDRGRFQDPTSIYIDKGRIQWIGAEAEHKLSSETKVLDAAGRFAIPGLIDLRTTLGSQRTREPGLSASGVGRVEAFLAFGVTTVLDIGSDLAQIQTWSDRRQAMGSPIPRIISHPAVIKTIAYSNSGEPLLTETSLRERVQAAKAEGAQGISAAPELPWQLQRVLADEAAKQGLVVSGLGHQPDQLIQGALLGHWSAPGVSTSPPPGDDLVQLLAKTRAYVGTNLSAPWGNSVLFRQEPARRSDPSLAFFSASDRSLSQHWLRAVSPETQRQAYERSVGGLQLAHHGDVHLAVGSGAPSVDCFYGHCLHTELWHLAQAGLTPLQILRQATLGNAEALGAAEHFGSLAPGKFADLVLLDKDPLADLHNTLSVVTVISEGRPFKDGKPLVLTAAPPAPAPSPAPPRATPSAPVPKPPAKP